MRMKEIIRPIKAHQGEEIPERLGMLTPTESSELIDTYRKGGHRQRCYWHALWLPCHYHSSACCIEPGGSNLTDTACCLPASTPALFRLYLCSPYASLHE